MRPSLAVIGSALLAASSAELLAPSSSTSDPTITPAPEVPIELFKKQNDDRFMGWISVSGSYTSRRCDLGGTYYQSGDFWRCCATTVAGCNVPIGCVGGSLVYSFADATGTQPTIGTYACTEIYTDATDSSFSICNTGFMYENTQDSDPRTNVFCGVSSLNWSYYRIKPEVSTPVTPSSSSRSSTPQSTAASATGAESTDGPTALPQPEEKKEKSKAWIAGAVVGPIAGLAIIGAGLWFCLFRRKKKTQAQPQQAVPGAPGSHPPPSYGGSPNLPPPQPYQNYPPQMQQNGPGMVPFGVAKHDSWAPQSPQTQGSGSPQPPHSPYGPPGQQQWQPPQQQPGNPQMLNPSPQVAQQQTYPPPSGTPTSPHSPQPQNAQPYVDNGAVNKPPHMEARHFSSELEAKPYQQPELVQQQGGR